MMAIVGEEGGLGVNYLAQKACLIIQSGSRATQGPGVMRQSFRHNGLLLTLLHSQTLPALSMASLTPLYRDRNYNGLSMDP